MAVDEWVAFDDVELVNLSRTAQLSSVLGIDSLWVQPGDVQWVQDVLGETGYDDVTQAPWYRSHIPASAEFAGIVPLSIRGLNDSTMSATVTEYVTDGGSSGTMRGDTLPIVVGAVIMASTSRGASYGKKWLDRALRAGSTASMMCSGWDLNYFDVDGPNAKKMHRRRVRATRGASVTQKRSNDCSTMWWVTFTLTANDPYEYGEPVLQIAELSESAATGPNVDGTWFFDGTYSTCPSWSYDPTYDPTFPALVEPPSSPEYLPESWLVSTGDPFRRWYINLGPDVPEALTAVPLIEVSSTSDARMIRVSLWEDLTDGTQQCDALMSVMITYLPAGQTLYIDGEQQSVYLWDGASPAVSRADTLVFNFDARPTQWKPVSLSSDLALTLDVFTENADPADVSARFSLIQKSD